MHEITLALMGASVSKTRVPYFMSPSFWQVFKFPNKNLLLFLLPYPLPTPPPFRFSRTHRTGKENNMIKINLRHYYPHYTSDVYIEVPDNIAIELHTFENEDAAFRMRKSRNRAFYSLDREDGFERELLNSAPSSEDGFFREHLACSLFSALQEIRSRICYSATAI